MPTGEFLKKLLLTAGAQAKPLASSAAKNILPSAVAGTAGYAAAPSLSDWAGIDTDMGRKVNQAGTAAAWALAASPQGRMHILTKSNVRGLNDLSKSTGRSVKELLEQDPNLARKFAPIRGPLQAGLVGSLPTTAAHYGDSFRGLKKKLDLAVKTHADDPNMFNPDYHVNKLFDKGVNKLHGYLPGAGTVAGSAIGSGLGGGMGRIISNMLLPVGHGNHDPMDEKEYYQRRRRERIHSLAGLAGMVAGGGLGAHFGSLYAPNLGERMLAKARPLIDQAYKTPLRDFVSEQTSMPKLPDMSRLAGLSKASSIRELAVKAAFDTATIKDKATRLGKSVWGHTKDTGRYLADMPTPQAMVVGSGLGSGLGYLRHSVRELIDPAEKEEDRKIRRNAAMINGAMFGGGAVLARTGINRFRDYNSEMSKLNEQEAKLDSSLADSNAKSIAKQKAMKYLESRRGQRELAEHERPWSINFNRVKPTAWPKEALKAIAPYSPEAQGYANWLQEHWWNESDPNKSKLALALQALGSDKPKSPGAKTEPVMTMGAK
jgi:hypothetical protein